MIKRKYQSNRGQALVEFALILTVLLMMIFLIIESARIMWGWATVQHAAREGARYAVTGQFMGDDTTCAISNLVKFSNKCGDYGNYGTTSLRTSSIISTTYQALAGLPLNETSGISEDDYYYDIQVYGVDSGGQLLQDFGGSPGNPVIVRVIYRVPIITPFFQPIIESIPLFGQVTMTNESFGQLGSSSQGTNLAPPLPQIPTAGPTPSDTPTATATITPTVGATSTATNTPTITPTATPDICDVEFEGQSVGSDTTVLITGEPDSNVTIINLTTGETLGTALLITVPGHACPGFADFQSNPFSTPLVAGHVLLAQSDDGTFDTTIVLVEPPTVTPTPTETIVPTPTPTQTPTPTTSPTPGSPYIYLLPDCGSTESQFNVLGVNWPTNETIVLTWNGGGAYGITAPNNFFQQTWTKYGLAPGVYTVKAESIGYSDTAAFKVPCDDATAVPTVEVPTSTPAPEDLLIIGPPALVSTPPIVAYAPVQFSLNITNAGDIDVNNQFFVDLYLDPTTVISTGIPISQSSGFMGVSSLAGRTGRVITITAPLGFKNEPAAHTIYGMVDSIMQVTEADETNNVSPPITIGGVITVAVTPTPTPTPPGVITGTGGISGTVRTLIDNWTPQFRATVTLIDEATSTPVTTILTDQNGFFVFSNVPNGTYTLIACASIDNLSFTGSRTGIVPPNPYGDVFMLPGVCP